MQRLYRRFLVICLPLLLTILFGFKDKGTVHASKWRDTEIAVDGNALEWAESLTYLEKENFAFGVQNDQSNLYLCFQLDRHMQRQAMRFGFTVWLDSTARNKKILGIRFPIGAQNYDDNWTPDFGPRSEEGFEEPPPRGEEGTDEPPPRREGGFEGQQRFTEMLSEIEIIGPDKDDRNRIPVHNAYGIQVAMSEFSAELVYELKVPLHVLKGQPYAVSTAVGKTISLGFEMGEFNREKMREQFGRGRGGFGGGRPGGGMGGGPPGGFGRPGGPGGSRPEMPKPLKVWIKVQLAISEESAGSKY